MSMSIVDKLGWSVSNETCILYALFLLFYCLYTCTMHYVYYPNAHYLLLLCYYRYTTVGCRLDLYLCCSLFSLFLLINMLITWLSLSLSFSRSALLFAYHHLLFSYYEFINVHLCFLLFFHYKRVKFFSFSLTLFFFKWKCVCDKLYEKFSWKNCKYSVDHYSSLYKGVIIFSLFLLFYREKTQDKSHF